MESLAKDNEKRTIALNYLSISARKLTEAHGYDAALSAVKTLHTYIRLAQQYGCTESEMMFALGYGRERMRSLIAQVQ